VKRAVNFIGAFENAVVNDARKSDVHGVICGHIHAPAMRGIGECLYINTGDWVDSCTALVEDASGALEIIRWTHIKATDEVVELDDARVRSAA
jgi:UDP-2,3-diacylglucosamine pyrophosphatase LpxH